MSVTLQPEREGVWDRFTQRRAEKKALKKRYRDFCITPFTRPLSFAWLVVLMGAGTYVGVLIVAALYYLLVGADWTPLNLPWHHLVADDTTRHMIRNVGEGLLGGLLGQMVGFNYYKKVVKKKPNVIDKFAAALRIPSAWDDKMAGPFAISVNWLAVLVFAIPGFIIGNWAIGELHHLLNWVISNQETYGVWDPSLGNRMKHTVTNDYDMKLVGFFAAWVFGRRAALGVMNDVQERFATIRICNNKPLRRYHSPTYKARYKLLQSTGVNRQLNGSIENAMLKVGMAVGLGLAITGWYVLNFVAYGINPFS